MKQNGNILIADTQFLTTEALRSVLTEAGYEVSVVTARSALLEHLQKHEVSLIVTDYILFDFRSINDLRELRELHAGSPILVLCNSVNQMQIKELNNAGIRNIAMKTDDRVELLQAVAIEPRHALGVVHPDSTWHLHCRQVRRVFAVDPLQHVLLNGLLDQGLGTASQHGMALVHDQQ